MADEWRLREFINILKRRQVTKADISIREAVVQAAKENGLTFAELVMILANIISGWSKFEIREERTP